MTDSCCPWARPVTALAGVLLLASCSGYGDPDFYSPPEQRPQFEDPARWERIVHMTDVDAPDHFVSDIVDPLAANWRWTSREPTIHLGVPPRARLKYHIEFVIPQQTISSTGPVTLTFLVDGRALYVKRYEAAGAYRFEQNIPPDWIVKGGETRIGAKIDKLFNANGRSYGFLLISIGLTRS